MTSSQHFEGDIMFFTGYGSLFSDKSYTTVAFTSFRMSAFIFGVCFNTFIIGVIKDKNSNEEIHFTNNSQNILNVGHICRHNIIRGPVGLKNAASKAKTEIDHFHYLLNFLLISTKISNTQL